MIKNIKFSNFYSFENQQELSFVAKKKSTHDYFNSSSGDQITKIAGFVGGNASGKTNISRLFSFLNYFVCVGSKSEDFKGFDIAYKTFFNNKKSSDFYVEFEVSDTTFFYEFSIKENKILKEVMSFKKIKKGAVKNELFSRSLNNECELNKTYFKNFPKDFLKNMRLDVSIIAFLKANYDVEIINILFDYFSRFKTNINEKGEIHSYDHQVRSLGMYLKDSKLKKEMEDFVRHFDVGLDNFDIKREIKNKDSKDGIYVISVEGIHQTKEKNNRLDFMYESRGTQSLFFALVNILTALKQEGVVIIDEIESGFHPEALNKILRYFIDKNSERRAQLIFSSHSLGFMNKLDMHQIYLVKKDNESRSIVYRLNEVEGVRTDENFLAKYMSGAYGAFPKITI